MWYIVILGWAGLGWLPLAGWRLIRFAGGEDEKEGGMDDGITFDGGETSDYRE